MKITFLLTILTSIMFACQQIPKDNKQQTGKQTAVTVGSAKSDTSKSESENKDEEIQKMINESVGIDGSTVKAFLVAYNDFLGDKDISKEKKNLEHYDIGFRNNKEFFEISFISVKEEGKKPSIGGVTKYAQPVIYRLSKDEFKIMSKSFPQ